MAHRSVLDSTHEPEIPKLDGDVKWITSGRGLVRRATETLSEVCTMPLLVLLAAEESVNRKRVDAYIEQLREYGDWVD